MYERNPGQSFSLMVQQGADQFTELYTDNERNRGAAYLFASWTKTVTATAVMQLVDGGSIQLDDSVSEYIPGTPPAITIRHLLTHTSGLDNYTKYYSGSNLYNQGVTPADLVGQIVEQGFLSAVGSVLRSIWQPLHRVFKLSAYKRLFPVSRVGSTCMDFKIQMRTKAIPFISLFSNFLTSSKAVTNNYMRRTIMAIDAV
ncbi:beta-lactamase family protein [Candidatus Woesebacteria bacterium]|nr:beta-lactamase family protein [Candidatus Woesebacteria bacterium]